MTPAQELFVAGGAELYQQTLAECQRLYLTFIGAEFEGDAFFPRILESQWLLVSEESHEPDEKNAYPYCYRIYERKSRGTEDRG